MLWVAGVVAGVVDSGVTGFSVKVTGLPVEVVAAVPSVAAVSRGRWFGAAVAGVGRKGGGFAPAGHRRCVGLELPAGHHLCGFWALVETSLENGISYVEPFSATM